MREAEPSDADLYLRSVQGDRDAVEQLVARFHPMLGRYVRSKGVDRATADDVVGETWMSFFRHLDRASSDPAVALRSPGSVQFWLLKTAANGVNSHYRSESRHRERARRATNEATVQGHAVAEADVIDRLEGDDRRAALQEAFGQLSDRCRELLTLLMAEPPLSYAEVAELLGRSVGYIGPTRQRCLGELRTILGLVSSR